ncbi:MAG: hypothetical protein EKK55_12470 [Rhodocyclaceae bacterium]|nr:MAG: hypothetical protein EKK55_12470 [Rhodocyclaceae bacterium]
MNETPEASETDPWHARIRSAPAPTVLYHATTPRKLARYRATGTILPPVRGFDTVEACQRFMRRTGRTLMLRVTPTVGPWPLPDHHHASQQWKGRSPAEIQASLLTYEGGVAR